MTLPVLVLVFVSSLHLSSVISMSAENDLENVFLVQFAYRERGESYPVALLWKSICLL